MVVPVPEIFFSPKAALSSLKDSARPLNSVLLAASAWLSLFTGSLLMLNKPLTLGQFLTLTVLLGIVFFMAILAKTMLVHFFAEILGGEGKLTQFLLLLAYSYLPLHFVLPLGLILKQVSWFMILPVFILLAAWVSHLGFRALQIHYGLSFGKCMIAGLAPSIFFLLPVIVFLTLFTGFLISLSLVLFQTFAQLSMLP